MGLTLDDISSDLLLLTYLSFFRILSNQPAKKEV